MFGMSVTEIGLILILGLIVFGPERVPKVARTVGRFIRDMRRTASDIQRTFEVEEIRRELKLRNTDREETKFGMGATAAVGAAIATAEAATPEVPKLPMGAVAASEPVAVFEGVSAQVSSEGEDSDEVVQAALTTYLDAIANEGRRYREVALPDIGLKSVYVKQRALPAAKAGRSMTVDLPERRV